MEFTKLIQFSDLESHDHGHESNVKYKLICKNLSQFILSSDRKTEVTLFYNVEKTKMRFSSEVL